MIKRSLVCPLSSSFCNRSISSSNFLACLVERYLPRSSFAALVASASEAFFSVLIKPPPIGSTATTSSVASCRKIAVSFSKTSSIVAMVGFSSSFNLAAIASCIFGLFKFSDELFAAIFSEYPAFIAASVPFRLIRYSSINRRCLCVNLEIYLTTFLKQNKKADQCRLFRD